MVLLLSPDLRHVLHELDLVKTCLRIGDLLVSFRIWLLLCEVLIIVVQGAASLMLIFMIVVGIGGVGDEATCRH